MAKQSGAVVIKGLSGDGIDLLAVGQDFTRRLWKRDGSGLTRFYLFGKPGEPLLKKGEGDVILSPEYTIYQMDTHSIPIEEFRRNQREAVADIVLSNFDGVKEPRALFDQAVADLEGFLDEGALIREMERNVREIIESYKTVVAEKLLFRS